MPVKTYVLVGDVSCGLMVALVECCRNAWNRTIYSS